MVPWTAVNLVDYYLIRHGEYDVPSFFAADGGIYGRYNVAALVCYVLGILVQVPFIASDVYTGPVARALGGIDFSWIVGLVAVSGAYYFGVRVRTRPTRVRLIDACPRREGSAIDNLLSASERRRRRKI
jgi:NCS1 family nucleobase:cation symporter-1